MPPGKKMDNIARGTMGCTNDATLVTHRMSPLSVNFNSIEFNSNIIEFNSIWID